ncbi:Ig-like domain-containing protein [Candidatus Hadarchaeum sp.]|uniref:Ig-like domain-containing protein n=1 Tax=Candidatus Hadarchaeum sp. TaxID=2883567 RepID=UPI003D0FC965
MSTSSVSATHTQTVSIDKTLLPYNKKVTLTVTVKNNGPDAIDNVRIILPSGFTGPEVLAAVPAGTDAQLAAVDNENVVIPAGTKVKILAGSTVTIPADTEVIRLADENVRVENTPGSPLANRVLLENVRIKKAAAVTTDNLGGENVNLNEDTKLALKENDVVTLAETIVVRKSGGIYTLVDDAHVKVHDDVNVGGVTGAENVVLLKDTAVTVSDGSSWITQHAVSTKVGIDTYTLVAGAYVTLTYPENKVVLPAGSKVVLNSGANLMLYENTEVIRKAGENIYVATDVENRPNGWSQSVSGSTLEWVGISDNKIPAGGSLAFPFTVTTPPTTGDYTIYVRAKDKAGALIISEITVTVDATSPTVTVEVSPKYVKANTKVTIKVTASEALAKLDNVMVEENNGENVQITMTPSADKKVWTGTYTTSDNLSRDGLAKVYVIGADYEDLAGNTGSSATDSFTIDRRAPPAPNLSALTAWITENATRTPAPGLQTNVKEWTIEGTAQDNFLDVIGPQEGITVKIRVGTQVFTVSADSSGYFYKDIVLSEGKQEVGIKYIDKAGNEGPENYENVTVDTVAPSISITAPSKEYINDNTPLIRVLISDATLGVENTGFNAADNTGYTVQLRRDDNTVVDTLAASSTIVGPFKSATFENQYPTELPDNLYHIYVRAGDNLQYSEAIFKFHIDTVAPAAPTGLAGTITGGTATVPTATTVPSVTLSGTAESKATIKVYTTTNAGVTWTEYAAGRTTAGSNWTTTVDLTGFAGKTVGIAVSATDLAGNEGDKQLYGYLLYTPAPPANLAGSLVAGATAALAKATSVSTLNLAGTATANYKIKVYTTTDGGVTWTEYTAGATTASATGAWTTSVSLSGFAGKTVGIAVTATDAGGNESTKTIYGYLIYDAKAPSVEITSPASGTTTDQATIQITGKVTKDAWESYSNITLTLQVGVGSVEVPISSDGTFTYSVALAEGMNTIVARATDGVNVGTPVSITVTRTVTPWSTYAIIIVIVALILAAIAIFRRR